MKLPNYLFCGVQPRICVNMFTSRIWLMIKMRMMGKTKPNVRMNLSKLETHYESTRVQWSRKKYLLQERQRDNTVRMPKFSVGKLVTSPCIEPLMKVKQDWKDHTKYLVAFHSKHQCWVHRFSNHQFSKENTILNKDLVSEEKNFKCPDCKTKIVDIQSGCWYTPTCQI